MIFVDSNVPMYFIGGEHPHKHQTVALLQKLAGENARLVTSAEVFQEIIHRYAAIRKAESIQICFDALKGLVEEIFPVTYEDVVLARDVFLRYQKISARDALHAAQMKRFKIETIFSFDSGFDILPWVKRLPVS
jgi:hypothetical protein